jgi:hypothetical protein
VPGALPTTMTAADFFALLRTRVPSERLGVLMGALSDFNQRRLDKAALMATARAVLAHAPPLSGGTEVNLFAAFQQFMLRG